VLGQNGAGYLSRLWQVSADINQDLWQPIAGMFVNLSGGNI